MKTSIYLFLTAIITASVGCSTATKTTTANVNANARASSGAVVTVEPQPVAQMPEQPLTPEVQREKDAISALVKDLYAQHDAQKSPFFQTKNRALVDKYFDKNLADSIWKDANESADGEVSAIGFDPLYHARNPDIKNFAPASPRVNGDKATAAVSFENRNQQKTLTYTLARQKSDWKISDVDYGDGSTLLGIFIERDSHRRNVTYSSGEFEGTYRVGDMTCTVKPVNSAFEVKWEKGAGAAEMFFADDRSSGSGDKITFSSDSKKGKPSVFSFDNENYNSGIFYRADGKQFPMKRIK